tara:strand:- start:438 stop:1001 length:564 start_codon:yes stop_codon:yes gene_type:complete
MKDITKEIKNKYGNQFKDRKNSFDDKSDIEIFVKLVNEDEYLQNYLRQFLPKGVYEWREKPFGEYGVDLGLFLEQGKELIATFDLERWFAWGNEWPNNYRCIHFLERKEKFLNQFKNIPFFMAYLNSERNKVLMIEKNDICKYETITKPFYQKGHSDRVKVLSMKDGHLFGKNLTVKEQDLFNTYDS